MSLTNQEKQELKQLEQQLIAFYASLKKPPSVERNNDAQGDRLTVRQGSEIVDLYLTNHQINSNTKIT